MIISSSWPVRIPCPNLSGKVTPSRIVVRHLRYPSTSPSNSIPVPFGRHHHSLPRRALTLAIRFQFHVVGEGLWMIWGIHQKPHLDHYYSSTQMWNRQCSGCLNSWMMGHITRSCSLQRHHPPPLSDQVDGRDPTGWPANPISHRTTEDQALFHFYHKRRPLLYRHFKYSRYLHFIRVVDGIVLTGV